MTKINRRIKFISLLLCILLLLANFPILSVALESASAYPVQPAVDDPVVVDALCPEEQIESVDLTQLKVLGPGEKTLAELQTMSVNVSALPEFISSEVAIQRGHVNRLEEQEASLNTVIYQNQNGTKSTYIFAGPVKYFDGDGNIRDKSTQISSVANSLYPYAMVDNSVQVYFPSTSKNGTKIQFQNYSILITPQTTNFFQPTYHSNDQTVKYDGVFGTNTAIVYQTKLNGLKEDIILYQNVGKNSFDFDLRLTNLTPIQTDDIWYLKNNEGQIIASFGKILIKDSAGSTVEGSMTITPAVGKGQYRATVIAPETFINDSSTVYPVYVDPSTYIWEEDWYYYYDDEYGYEYSESYDAIIDTGLYTTSSAVSTAASNEDYHRLGYASSASGKVIYKLYDFFGEHGQYKNLQDNQIGTAHLYIQVGSGTAATFTVQPMTATWNNSSVGENPIALSDASLWNAYSSSYSSSLYIDSTSGERAIDITEILRGWARYNAGTSANAYDNPANGFVLSSSATTSARNVTAVEEFYADSVYVLMDTSFIGGVYYVNNINTGKFLRRSTNTTLSTSTYSNTSNIRWKFEYLGNDEYYIRSAYNPNYILYGSGSNVSLAYLPSNPSDQYIWEVRTATGGGVTIKNVYSGRVLRYDGESLSLATPFSSSDINYKQTTWGIVLQSDYINLSSFAVTYDEWLSVGSSKNIQLTVTPSNATWKTDNCFTWKSSDPSVATISDTGRITAVGDGYTNITVTHKQTGRSHTFPVVIGEMIPYGTYQIRNIDSGKYVEIEGPSSTEGAYIQQGDHHNGSYSKWRILYYGSGYYCIWSAYNAKYIGTNGTNIIQTDEISDSSKWKITVTSDGNYKFVAKSSEANNLAMAIPYSTTADGVNLQQIAYTDNSVFTDEWLIDQEYDASLIAIPETYNRTSFFSSTKSDLASLGYLNIYAEETCMNHNFMLNHMEKSKITIIRTHGNTNLIITSNESISVNSMSTLDSDYLSNSELIIYGACLTGFGRGTATNLVNTTHQKGSSIVIGFEKSVWNTEVNDWIEEFFNSLAAGKSVYESCQDADNYIRDYWAPNNPKYPITTDSWYVAGNANTIF